MTTTCLTSRATPTTKRGHQLCPSIYSYQDNNPTHDVVTQEQSKSRSVLAAKTSANMLEWRQRNSTGKGADFLASPTTCFTFDLRTALYVCFAMSLRCDGCGVVALVFPRRHPPQKTRASLAWCCCFCRLHRPCGFFSCAWRLRTLQRSFFLASWPGCTSAGRIEDCRSWHVRQMSAGLNLVTNSNTTPSTSQQLRRLLSLPFSFHWKEVTATHVY